MERLKNSVPPKQAWCTQSKVKMEFVNLGKSGLKVSKIILGGMSFGSKSWRDWVLEDEEEVFKILKHAYDNGIRTWDTANMYSNGESERLIGKFLKKYNIPRSSVVILTKGFMPIDDDERLADDKFKYINRQGLSRKHLFDAVEASVERLGTYIDVYQIHRLDRDTPKEEIMEALHDLVKSGKVRYIGASTMRATEFAQLQFIAEKNGWTKFISMQNYHNLIYREEEREMIPFCKETGVGLIPWSPIGRGVLARPSRDRNATNRAKTDDWVRDSTSVMDIGTSDNSKAIIDRVEEVAKKRGVSMAAVAIAWSLSKGMIPIVGFSGTHRVDDALKALEFNLSEEESTYLEELYQPVPVQGWL
uniref:ARAD1B09284p n=1 Tax=Blastobotrys adeninivorans TaxID=409370 RepID=A0A060TBM4_BLAAD